jgi:Tfp pilus assembly protein PilF
MIRLSLDPASRGQSMTPKVMQQFGQAMQMDPQNPRAMALMARMKMGTAQFFGQSTAEPCGMAQASLKLFAAEEPAPLHPRWGKELAEEMIEACGK